MATDFFRLPDGRTAKLYTIQSPGGLKAEISDFGGILWKLNVPDREGKPVDVVLGFADPAEYISNGPYFGAVIGRVGNRIREGRFTLDGVTYQLPVNRPGSSLHGGDCYCFRLWDTVEVTDRTVHLRLVSPDGDSGYPGEVTVDVIFHAADDNTLEIETRGTTDRPTILAMTNHSYFNLNGEGSGTLDGQSVAVYADAVQEVDENLVPDGTLMPVVETVYDLRTAETFSDIFLDLPDGIDNSFVDTEAVKGNLRKIAEARSEQTGIVLECLTTDPAIQLYTGYFLDGSCVGKSGVRYPRFSGFCFETQQYVDAANHPQFPSIRLNPGETYCQKAHYRFSAK